MDIKNDKEQFYTDVLHCVLDVLVKLYYFVDIATDEELLKLSHLVDLLSMLYCTIARGIEMGAKEKEKKTLPI